MQGFAGPPLRVGPNNTLEQYIIDDTVLPLVPYCLNIYRQKSSDKCSQMFKFFLSLSSGLSSKEEFGTAWLHFTVYRHMI